MRGVLLRFSELESSSTHSGPEASLEIEITQRSPNQILLVEDLVDVSPVLFDNIGRDRRSKVAVLNDPELEFLRNYFRELQPTSDVEAEEDMEKIGPQYF